MLIDNITNHNWVIYLYYNKLLTKYDMKYKSSKLIKSRRASFGMLYNNTNNNNNR